MRMLDFGRVAHYQMQGTGVMNSGYAGAKGARSMQNPPGAQPNKSAEVPGPVGIKKKKKVATAMTPQRTLSSNLMKA